MTQPYDERRKRALEGFAGGVAVIPSARIVARNNDTEYEFRQNSDFYYLTGFDEPDCVLVLAPENGEHRSVLFLRERNRAHEIWNGRRLGVEGATAALGVDAAFPIAELEQRLPQYFSGSKTLWYALGNDDAMDRSLLNALESARAGARRKGVAPQSISEPANVIHPLRQIKSFDEIAIMRHAAEITGRGHVAGMRITRPGIFEYEVEAAVEYEYRRAGAQRDAYETIVGSGDNATILHYVSNRDMLVDGALVLVDSGCEYNYYASDVTRTWPVNGRFSPEQRAIYEIVLAAQLAAIREIAPNRPQNAFHQAAVRVITEGLIDLGLLHGSVDENIEQERYRDYYMHGTGHWLGLDVHDVGRYRQEDGEPVLFAPGMAITVEPGIYIHRDLDCDERFKGIGVRIEDDILVSEHGNENLTVAIPKEIDELEEVVGAGITAAIR